VRQECDDILLVYSGSISVLKQTSFAISCQMKVGYQHYCKKNQPSKLIKFWQIFKKLLMTNCVFCAPLHPRPTVVLTKKR